MGKLSEPDIASNIINQPKTADDALAAEMRRHTLPALFPNRIEDAVQFWKDLNEPYNLINETPRLVPVQGKDKENSKRWVCPYNERLIYTLRKFLKLKPRDREIVLAGIREDKVWWRGDSIDFYSKVIDEDHKMREMGVAEYRKQSIKKMKTMMGRF